jgi:hypothetical protein
MSSTNYTEGLPEGESELLLNGTLIIEIRNALRNGFTREHIIGLLDQVKMEQMIMQTERRRIENAIMHLFDTLSTGEESVRMQDLMEAIRNVTHNENIHIAIVFTPKFRAEDGNDEFPSINGDVDNIKPRVKVLRNGQEFFYTYVIKPIVDGFEIKLV